LRTILQTSLARHISHIASVLILNNLHLYSNRLRIPLGHFGILTAGFTGNFVSVETRAFPFGNLYFSES
jgi:hypothetical protein